MPYLPNARQYRSFAASNFKPVERDAEGVDAPPYRVRGHFTVFNYEYELYPGVYERVMPTALDECDMSDVIFQYDHQGMVLARQRNGSLRVGVDETGGWCEATLDGCQQARDLYEAVTNGLVDEMSFGFTIADDGWEWDEDDEGNVHTRITKVGKLFDVSCVSIPASDATEISARSLKDAIDEARAKKAELASDNGAVSDANEPEERTTEEAIESPEDVLEPAEIDDAIDDETLRRYAEAIIAEMDRRNAQVELEIKGTVEELDVEPAPVGECSTEGRVAEPDRRSARMRRARALALKTI